MQAFDPLIALSRKYSTHICCLHHRRKATALQFRDDALGSQALNASVDTVLSLAVDKDECRQISAYGRDDAYLSKNRIVLSRRVGMDRHFTNTTPPLKGGVGWRVAMCDFFNMNQNEVTT